MTLSIVATLGLNVNAQNQGTQSSDGFFNSTLTDITYRSEEDQAAGELPLAPTRFKFVDQDAPLGSGLLLLAGMGAAYALRRKRK